MVDNNHGHILGNGSLNAESDKNTEFAFLYGACADQTLAE
jgi:hypothetical protein